MIVIAGLGNPGKQYERTRHNIGFEVVDRLADQFHIDVNFGKFGGLIGKGVIEGEKVLLVKPLTYMNLSGECIAAVMHYYKSDPEDELIAIYDDISLEPGEIRIREKGSAGGHNGIKSIISHLQTERFKRIKVGVGDKPRHMDLADHVLGRFSKEETVLMEDGVSRSLEALPLMISGDVKQAMNRYNKRRKGEGDAV